MEDPWVGHVFVIGIYSHFCVKKKKKKAQKKRKKVLIYYHLFVFIERDLACC